MPKPPKRGTPRSDWRAVLAEWRGAQARLWFYGITHKCLVIRLESENREGNLHIEMNDTYFIQMPTVWFNANIEVSWNVDYDRFGLPMSLLIDKEAGVRILALGIGFYENAEPLMKVIYPKDHAMVLDQYMRVWRGNSVDRQDAI